MVMLKELKRSLSDWDILSLIDELNQYQLGNVTDKGLEEALQSALNQLKNK
jgi:hypothetical protein